MADRFSRFLNLERTRPQAPGGAGGAGSSGRFDALEAPPAAGDAALPASVPVAPAATPGEVAAEAARVGHFGPSGPALELEQSRPEDQPFIRCACCQADNSPFAQACQFCGADFNTAAQRAFNERLWAQRREEAAHEAQALSQFQQQRAQADVGLAGQRLQAAQARAAQVAQETRLRLECEERADSGGLRGLVSQNLKAGLSLAALVVYLVLLIVPATRRFVLLGTLALAALYVRIVWGRGRRRW